MMGEMVFLGTQELDMTPLMVDVKNINRDQRRSLLEKCNAGCKAKISGNVGSVLFQDGLIARSVVVE